MAPVLKSARGAGDAAQRGESFDGLITDHDGSHHEEVVISAPEAVSADAIDPVDGGLARSLEAAVAAARWDVAAELAREIEARRLRMPRSAE